MAGSSTAKFFTSFFSSATVIAPAVVTFKYILADQPPILASITDVTMNKMNPTEPGTISPSAASVAPTTRSVRSSQDVLSDSYGLLEAEKPDRKEEQEKFSFDDGDIQNLKIPKRCKSKFFCDLTGRELKKLKFENSGDESPKGLKVEGLPGEERAQYGKEVTVLLDAADPDKKKYIFLNPLEREVKIKKGDKDLVTLKESGITKFTEENGKLKERTLNDYGIPNEGCDKSCTLSPTDLKDIKFEGFSSEEGTAVSVEPRDKTVTLTIEQQGSKKIYKFNNSDDSTINIKNYRISSGRIETLNTISLANGDTEFKEVGDSKTLKYIERSDGKGIPVRCNNNSSNCKLSEDNLKNIKFDALGEESQEDPEIEEFPTEEQEQISLEIDSTDPDKKRYIFTNPTSKEVKIKKGDKNSVTLKPGKTKFTEEEGNKLKERVLNEYGLPKEGCENSCTLISSELEEIKYDGLDSGKASVTSNKKVTLTTDSSGTTKTYKFKTTDQLITIKKGTTGKNIYLFEGETEFKEESSTKTLKYIEPKDSNGIPKKCSYFNSCELSEENLKNIKFDALGEESQEDPEIEEFPSEEEGKISLEIDSTDPTKKRYIFTNPTSKEVKIKKGSDEPQKEVTLAPGKKTKFTEEGNKLKERKLNDYGVPKVCEDSKPCTLISSDLEDIKYKGFSSVSGSLSVTEKKTTTLTIDSTTSPKTYNFETSEPITISKGSYFSGKTITLEGTGKFEEDSSSQTLKYIEPVDSSGIPVRCSKSLYGSCQLSEDNLKKIVFKEFEGIGGEVSVEDFPTEEEEKEYKTINLEIDAADPSQKKYIFTNTTDKDVKIKKGSGVSQKTITIKKGEKTKFSTIEESKLKQFTLDEYGIPDDCTWGCSLYPSDLKDIKFEDLGTDNEDVKVLPKDQTVNFKTETIGSKNKKIYKFENSGSSIYIYKSDITSEDKVILFNGETEFKEVTVDSKKVLRYMEPTDDYGIPVRCNDYPNNCELSEGNLENIKFENKGDEDATVEEFPTEEEEKILLTIDSADITKKKYIFNNTSSKEVKIKWGTAPSQTTVTLTPGETKFYLQNSTLKENKLGDYGLPSFCESSCTLSYSDLKDIKFEDLGTGNEDATVSHVDQTVTLTIDQTGSRKKYKFNNRSYSEITITKEEKTAILLMGDTDFKENKKNKVLKYVEKTDIYGIPVRCNEDPYNCELTKGNLENVKFEKLGEETSDEEDATVEGFPTGGEKILLTIDSADPNKNRYIFQNESSTDVKIKNGTDPSKTVTLGAGKKTKFTIENNKLKERDLNKFGLPSDCVETCTLTSEDLEDVNFLTLKKGKGAVIVDPSEKSLTLTIETKEPNKKMYLFQNSSSEEITITRGGEGNGLIFKPGEDTKFIEVKDNLHEAPIDFTPQKTRRETNGEKLFGEITNPERVEKMLGGYATAFKNAAYRYGLDKLFMSKDNKES